MKVTVICPTMNRPVYLKRALDSVRSQTWSNFEIIVINDGTDPATAELLSEYTAKDARIRVFKGPATGPAAARNAGLKQTAGNLVAFLDDDDYWAPEKLEKQVQLHTAYPSLGMSFTDGYVVDPSGKPLRDLLAQENPAFKDWIASQKIEKYNASVGDLYDLLIKDCLMGTSCVMIPFHVLEETGFFNEKYRIGEDYDLWLRVLEGRPAGILHERLTFYQVTDDGLSGSQDRRAFIWHAGISQMQHDRLAQTPEPYRTVMRDVLCTRAVKAAWFARTQKDMKMLRDMSGLILRHRPWLLKYWLFYFKALFSGQARKG